MSMPDMNAQGPFCVDPGAAVWTLVRDLVHQQHSIAELGQMLAAIRAEHVANPEEMISLDFDLKTFSDLATLKVQWYYQTLPSLVAKLEVLSEMHETFGDGPVAIDDLVDAALWRNKYHVALNAMTVDASLGRGRGDNA